jgi:hypothetical protein
MKREQIIEMANSAGLYSGANEIAWAHALERFAALVTIAEREECAKVCDKEHVDPHNLPAAIVAGRCADAIRARS